MRKILIWVLCLLAILCIAAVLLVNRWADTGHGKLNYKVALVLKLSDLGGGGPTKPGSHPSIAESRQQLIESASQVSGKPAIVDLVIDRMIPGPAGDIPVRIYTPIQKQNLPVVIFYHGGGWVQGNLDTHDNIARALAAGSDTIVVSVDYRLAPEHPFPAGVEDAYAALLWVFQNAPSFGGNPEKIAVAGDSAGGNLSAVITLIARDNDGPKILHQALIYPATNLSRLDTDSHRFFAEGFLLTKSKIELYRELYLPDKADWTNPYASPLLAMDHRDLPPATIITAEMDPLRDEGKQYADKLESAGVPVRYHNYKGMVHSFVSADKMLRQAHEALEELADDLRKSFANEI
jgi:acetyl esterase